ncbi:MAG: hypothetical protein RLZZ385_2086 [Pseudomonadota bacterium]|jgi:CPA2 family monovalent cation:H+ antiporter-2
MSQTLFQQYVIILTVSLLVTLLFRRLRLTTIVAYMAVGALVGPHALGLVAVPEQFRFVAEFGVVFLLFALGLEFSLKKMLAMRFAVFGVGGFQVLVCTAVFAEVVWLWGSDMAAAILIAGALALSSTAIVTRELLNNRELHAMHGQLSVGVLLFQDLAAVVFLILVPVLGNAGDSSLWRELLGAGFNTLVLLVILLAAGKWLLPVIYTEVAKSKSEEIFVLTTLVIVLLASWLTHAFHLSMPLGAFIIGMMLGEGSCKYQIESDIRPFKDILLGLFFVTIGMNLEVDLLAEYWLRILAFTALLILVKAAVVALLVKLLGYQSKDALVVGINLAQAGEFGLALLALALANGILPSDQASFIMIIATLSMAVSPFLIRHAGTAGRWLLRGHGGDSEKPAINLQLHDHVIIGGFGRLGTTVAAFLDQNAVPWIAIDADIDVVETQRRKGRNIIYGDSNNIEILSRCQLASARLVVLTFKTVEEGRAAIGRIRQRNAEIPIVVRCQDHRHYEELMGLGATHVFPEMLESSLLISRQVLGLLQVQQADIDAQMVEFLASLPARK